jgi:hypothetical protein
METTTQQSRKSWNTFVKTQNDRVLDTVSKFIVLKADGQAHGASFSSKFPALSIAETINGSVIDRDTGETVS